MNKKLLALLNQINAQKQKVVDLANDGKLEEAKAAGVKVLFLQCEVGRDTLQILTY